MLTQVLILSAAALLALSPAPLHPQQQQQQQQQQQREFSSRRISGSGSSSSSEEQIAFPTMRTRFQNQFTSLCLESSSDGKVFTSKCNKGLSQTWELNQRLRWRNAVTKQCLDMHGKGPVYTIFTRKCEAMGVGSQNWERRSDSGHFKNILYGKCMDQRARGVACHKGLNLMWNSI